MIYQSTIHRDLNSNSFSVFIILLSITLSVISVRVLESASDGNIDVSQVVVFLVLSMVALLPFLIQITTFIAVLQTFQRLYADSEMVIWETAKMPLFRWIKVILPLVLFMAMLTGVLVFFIRPWSFNVQDKLEKQYQAQQQWFNTTTGVFHPLSDNLGALYVEQDKIKNANLNNLFIFREIAPSIKNQGGISVIISRDGYTTATQDSSIIFNDGLFFEFYPQSEKFKKINFNSMGLSTITPYTQIKNKYYAMSSFELFKIDAPQSRAEIFWRSSMVLQNIVLSIFALGFAFSSPRKRNFLSIFVIIIVAVIYFNIINLGISLIEQQKINYWLLFFGTHLLFLILAFILIFINTYRFNLFSFVRYQLKSK